VTDLDAIRDRLAGTLFITAANQLQLRADVEALLAEVERLQADREEADRAALAWQAGSRQAWTEVDRLRAAIEENRDGVLDADDPSVAHEACERLWAVLKRGDDRD
jgi:uncharacterized membrane-anchored protein